MFSMSKTYQAYLVRFQRSPQAEAWRATLEDVHSQEIKRFATERELLLFLLRRLNEENNQRSTGNQNQIEA